MVEKRNIGLDAFRTLAIALVLFSHTRHIFTYIEIPGFNWWWLSVGGYLGVELFFVLSGFLIGNILIKEFLVSNNKKDNRIKKFFIRRWLRTFPLYFLVLLVYILFAFYKNPAFDLPYLHFVFLQNFDYQAVNFFGVAWSLSVEEWFYLLIPAVFFFFIKDRKSFIVTLGIVFISVILIKILYIFYIPEDNWTNIRKNIPFRFSSLIVGVGLAYVYSFKYELFKTLNCNRIFYFSLSILISLITWYYYMEQAGLDKDFFSKAFMFELTSIVLALVMVRFYFYFENNNLFFYYGSRYSYSIYLIHMLYLLPMIKLSHEYKNVFVSLGLLISFFVLTLFTSFIVYRYFEKPVFRFRDKLTT